MSFPHSRFSAALASDAPFAAHLPAAAAAVVPAPLSLAPAATAAAALRASYADPARVAAVPAGVPADVVNTLRASFNRALDDEPFRETLKGVGFAPLHSRSPAAIKEFVDADRARWSAVIKKLNISLD